MTEPLEFSDDYSLGYVRGLADTHGSLHLISTRAKNNLAITFRSLDEIVLDELALHLDILGYEYKRYVQAPGEDKQAQHMLRIHKQAEMQRFCGEVGFQRKDRAERSSKFLAEKLALVVNAAKSSVDIETNALAGSSGPTWR